MPDKRAHRGPHPEDEMLFARDAWPALREATSHLSWLLSRGYAPPSALKLVGDRFQLAQRQRTAVGRCACSDDAKSRRAACCVPSGDLDGKTLLLDGYNVLTSIEAALANGVILRARDGCFRDMASVHGTYRKVQETVPALHLIGEFLSRLGVAACHWYLDSPVSNSGRLKTIMLQVAAERGWRWHVELVRDPDDILAATGELVATADSGILDRCRHWTNLVREVIEEHVPEAVVVDLSVM